jgi:hypothetical protein
MVVVSGWIMAAQAREVFSATRYESLALVVVGLSGAAPFSILGVKLADKIMLPPQEIAGRIAGWWLLGNAAVALPVGLILNATHGAPVITRLGIAWLCFALGAFPKGLRSASTVWPRRQQMREWRAQLQEMETQSAVRRREHEAKMVVLRERAEDAKSRLDELRRLHPSSPWYRAYTGRW